MSQSSCQSSLVSTGVLPGGSSAGKAAALMKAVVTNRSEDDIIAISAFVASVPGLVLGPIARRPSL
jgi:hypothetical protein